MNIFERPIESASRSRPRQSTWNKQVVDVLLIREVQALGYTFKSELFRLHSRPLELHMGLVAGRKVPSQACTSC